MMRALVATKYGELSKQLALRDVPAPAISDTEVLIEAHAASINPIDYKIVRGDLKRIQKLTFPALLGFDVSGIVIGTGSRVTRFKTGDAVFARASRERTGTFAERIALPESFVAMRPHHLSHIEAASLPLVGLTTVQALADRAHAKPAQRILIHAGSGGVGTFAIQYAKTLEMHVTTTVSSKNADWVKALGADEIIRYDQESYLKAGRAWDIVFDTLGDQYTAEAFQVVKPGGVVVSIAGVPDRYFADQVQAGPMTRLVIWMMNRSIYRLAAKTGATYFRFLTESDGQQLAEIAKLCEAGKIKPVIDSVYPFSQSIDAMQHAAAGRVKGKVVLEIQPRSAQ